MDQWLDDHGYGSVEQIRGLFRAPRAESTRAAQAGEGTRARRDTAAGGNTHVMTISRERCTGCRACIGSCIHGALSMEGEIAVVDDGLCIGCGYCQDSCRYDAMRLEVRPA